MTLQSQEGKINYTAFGSYFTINRDMVEIKEG